LKKLYIEKKLIKKIKEKFEKSGNLEDFDPACNSKNTARIFSKNIS